MSVQSVAGDRTRHSVGLVVAAVLSWVPAVALLGSLLIAKVPAIVPTHWGFVGGVDSWSTVQAALWPVLLPGLIGGLLVTAVVIVSGDDIPRVKGSLGLAGIVLVTGGITFTWFASITIARDSHQTTQAFLVVALVAILLAGLVFCAATLPRRSTRLALVTPGMQSDDNH